MILDDIVNRFKISKYFKQLNIDIHQETIIEYLSYLQQSFAIYQVDKFDYSNKKIFHGNKKFYLVDLGLVHLYKGITKNFSMLLENIVFLKLRRDPNTKNIFYISNSFEIDFVTEDWQGNLALYQVTQELNNDNIERELKGFTALDQYLEKAPKTIINLNDFSKTITYQGTKIKQINLIEFLLVS